MYTLDIHLDDPSTWAIDWERDGFHASDGRNYTRDEFLAGKGFADHPDSIMIVEAPHFAPRGRYSRAQVYTEPELRQLQALADAADIEVMLFPAKQTVRAGIELAEANGLPDRDKTLDAAAILRFARQHSEIPLMYWRIPDDADRALWARRDLIRQDMSRRLNVMRIEAGYTDEESDRFREMLATILADARYTAQVARHFKVKVINKGRRDERTEVSYSQFMAVYVAVFDLDGNLRRNDQGEFIGLREVMALLWMHAFHGRGGTARSNLIHWGLRAREQGRKNGRQRELRAEFVKAVKVMAQIMRDYGLANGL